MSEQMAERQAAFMKALAAWRAAMTPEAALAEVEKVQAAGRAWAQEYAARRAVYRAAREAEEAARADWMKAEAAYNRARKAEKAEKARLVALKVGRGK